MTSKQIAHLRKQIDQIDQKILEFLSLRGKKVTEIGKIKKSLKANFHVPEREGKILASLKKLNTGPYSSEAIETIFREILSASLALESPLKIAYLGPEATFTHLAGIKHFGLSARFVPQETIQQVFQEVHLRRADYGVVPIENSTEGIVSYTLDLFVEHPLKICGEVKLPITHNLLVHSGDLALIKKVYSHPHALAQCRVWLDTHLPRIKTAEVTSTARAAEIASAEHGSAAIASEYAATRYHLQVLAKHIEDHPNNYTRFVVIGHQECGMTGHDKTSVMFSTKDEVGVLHRLLAPIAREKINLTKIESRPLKGRAWEYIFFIDLDGHRDDPRVKKALNGMAKRCSFLKVLGSYPKSS
jgi:chorismate mutase/prephenate dehydratase